MRKAVRKGYAKNTTLKLYYKEQLSGRVYAVWMIAIKVYIEITFAETTFLNLKDQDTQMVYTINVF